MKSKIFPIITLVFFLVSCTQGSALTSTETPSPVSTITATPSSTVSESIATAPLHDRIILFQDNFDSKSFNPKWKLLEGQPEITGAFPGMSTGKEKVILQINDSFPKDFTIQFDINQCGNDGYYLITIGNQIQFELLSDLSTNQRLYQDNQWIELPKGSIHRCATHIAILINSSSYIVLNVHNDVVIKILEGTTSTNLNGPVILTMTPYASLGHFLITSP
jgi:hypothetical protein